MYNLFASTNGLMAHSRCTHLSPAGRPICLASKTPNKKPPQAFRFKRNPQVIFEPSKRGRAKRMPSHLPQSWARPFLSRPPKWWLSFGFPLKKKHPRQRTHPVAIDFPESCSRIRQNIREFTSTLIGGKRVCEVWEAGLSLKRALFFRKTAFESSNGYGKAWHTSKRIIRTVPSDPTVAAQLQSGGFPSGIVLTQAQERSWALATRLIACSGFMENP